jgi:PDZ domain/SnoaL-like domain
MQRRVGLRFTTTVLIAMGLVACRTHTTSEQEEKKAAINVVLAHEQACEAYDFDKMDSLHTPDARVIEDSYPHPFEPHERRSWQIYKDVGMHVAYDPRDAVADVRGNIAWVTVTLHSVWTAATPVARTMLGGSEWRGTWMETFILEKTSGGWKIVFRHTSTLPPAFGVEPNYQQDHGGMKIAEVGEGSPAGKAGFKPGDVLIAYGGRKIDTPVDYQRLGYAYYEGERVVVTAMRGKEKITKEVTLGAMK